MQIDSININELFDNPVNKEEGFGVFLVVAASGNGLSVLSHPRLELCKVDSMDTFKTDNHARKWFAQKVLEGNNRYTDLFNQIQDVSPITAKQIVFAADMPLGD